MATYQRIKTFERADGKARLFILERDGLYKFVGEVEIEEDGFTFWMPAYPSGIYGNAPDAEWAARINAPWIDEQYSS